MNLLSLVSFFDFIGFSFFAVNLYKAGGRTYKTKMAVLLDLSVALWTFAYTFFYSAGTSADAWFWHLVSVPGWCCLPYFFLCSFLRILDTDGTVNVRRICLPAAAFPLVLMSAGIFFHQTPVASGLIRASGFWSYRNSATSVLFWLFIGSAVFYIGTIFFLLVHTGRRPDQGTGKLVPFIILFGTVFLCAVLLDAVLPLFISGFPPVAVLLLPVTLWSGWKTAVGYGFFTSTEQNKIQISLRESREKYRKLAYDYYRLANYDALTNLPNRRLFFKELDLFRMKAADCGQRFAVFYLDLNGFKEINDRYGHETGDEVLTATAARLLKCRGRKDFLARMGGDEFVLLTVAAVPRKLEKKARTIKSLFAETIVSGTTAYSVGIAVGYAVYSENGESTNSLLHRADMAMYHDKEFKDKKNSCLRISDEDTDSASGRNQSY